MPGGWPLPPRQGSRGRRRASVLDSRGPIGRAARGGSRPTAPREHPTAAWSLPNTAPALPPVERQCLALWRRTLTPETRSPRCLGDNLGRASTHLEAALASSSNSRKPNRKLVPKLGGDHEQVLLAPAGMYPSSRVACTVVLTIGGL